MAFATTTEAIGAAQRILEAISSEAVIAKLIYDGDSRVAHMDSFNRQNVVRTQLVAHSWRKIGRQVLAMHPAVVEEVRVASSDKIPAEVLRTLPYMNPLVVFADPPAFKTWLKPGELHPITGLRETSMRLLGFLTYGCANVRVNEPILHADVVKPGTRIEQRIYPTNSAEANRFGMMLVLEALDEAGKVIDLEFNSMTIYFDQDLTLAETVDDLMSRYHWDSPQANSGDNARNRKWMRDVMSVVVGSLFYLCSTTLEAEKVPTRATRHLGKGITRKPLSLYRIGWTTGAALTRYRQSRPPAWNESAQGDITHEQDPQHRKTHFKMQPYGPRNSLRKLIMVGAYWTKRDRLGEAGMNTAHMVPRVNGKGSATESVKTALEMRGVVLDP